MATDEEKLDQIIANKIPFNKLKIETKYDNGKTRENIFVDKTEIKFNKKYQEKYNQAKDVIKKAQGNKGDKPQKNKYFEELYNNKDTYNWKVIDNDTIELTKKDIHGNIKNHFYSRKSLGTDPNAIKKFDELIELGGNSNPDSELNETVESVESEIEDNLERYYIPNDTILKTFLERLKIPGFKNWLNTDFMPMCSFKNIYIKNNKLVTILPPLDYIQFKKTHNNRNYFTVTFRETTFKPEDLELSMDFPDIPEEYRYITPLDIIEEYVVNEYTRRLKNTDETDGYIFQRLKATENNKIIKDYNRRDQGWFYTYIHDINHSRKEIDAEFYFRFTEPSVKNKIESDKFSFYRHSEIVSFSDKESYIPIDFYFIQTQLMNGYLSSMLSIFTLPITFENVRKLAYKDYIDFTPSDDRIGKGDPDTNQYNFTKGWHRTDSNTITFKGRVVYKESSSKGETIDKFKKYSFEWKYEVESRIPEISGDIGKLLFCDNIPQIDVKDLSFIFLDPYLYTARDQSNKDEIRRDKSTDEEIKSRIKHHAEINPTKITSTIFYTNPILVENVSLTAKGDVLTSNVFGTVSSEKKSLLDPLKTRVRQPIEYLTRAAREYALNLNPSGETLKYLVYADMWYYNNTPDIDPVKFNDTKLELECNRIDTDDPDVYKENSQFKDRSYSTKFKLALTEAYLNEINSINMQNTIQKIVCNYETPQAKGKNKDNKGGKDKKKDEDDSSSTLYDIHTSADYKGGHKGDQKGDQKGGGTFKIRDSIKNHVSFKLQYDAKTGRYDDSKTKYYFNGIEFDGNNICKDEHITVPGELKKKYGDGKAAELKAIDEIQKNFKEYFIKKRKDNEKKYLENISKPVDFNNYWWYEEPKHFESDGSIDIYKTKIFFKKEEVDPEILKKLSSAVVFDDKNNIKGFIDPVDEYYSFKNILSMKLTEHYKNYYDAQNVIRDKTRDHLRKLKNVKEGIRKKEYNKQNCDTLLEDTSNKDGPLTLDPINGWWYDTVDIQKEDLVYNLYYKGRNIPKSILKNCDPARVQTLHKKIVDDFIRKNPEYKTRVDPDERSAISQTRRVIEKTIGGMYSGVKSVGSYGTRKIKDVYYGITDII
jgi:hypothetical protein